jgi:hypothetical protein
MRINILIVATAIFALFCCLAKADNLKIDDYSHGSNDAIITPKTLKVDQRELFAEFFERGVVADADVQLIESKSNELRVENENKIDDQVLCIRDAIIISNPIVEQNRFDRSLHILVSNRLDWAISGIRFRFRIISVGRSVPWLRDEAALEIPGGVEPGETRQLSLSLYSLTTQAPTELSAEIEVLDVADPDQRLLLGSVRVIGWSEERSPLLCNPSRFRSLSIGENAASPAAPSIVEPMTDEEWAEFASAVNGCWNIPTGLRSSGDIEMVVALELDADGMLAAGSIRMLDELSDSDARSQQLFEAARRALIRCSPYHELPREKHKEWHRLELTFNNTGLIKSGLP